MEKVKNLDSQNDYFQAKETKYSTSVEYMSHIYKMLVKRKDDSAFVYLFNHVNVVKMEIQNIVYNTKPGDKNKQLFCEMMNYVKDNEMLRRYLHLYSILDNPLIKLDSLYKNFDLVGDLDIQPIVLN